MPTIQSTYNARHARWYEGMVLNQEPADIITRSVEDVEGIGFGKVAVMGSADGFAVDSEITVPFLGIAVADPGQPADIYAQYSNVAILKRGVIVSPSIA